LRHFPVFNAPVAAEGHPAGAAGFLVEVTGIDQVAGVGVVGGSKLEIVKQGAGDAAILNIPNQAALLAKVL